MSTLIRTLRVAAAGALVALAVAAPAGAATVKLSGGSTTLKLDPGTAKALKGLGVSVTPIAPAKAGAKGVSFPITGGSIDPATAAGTITHSGGLQLRAGATRVRLTSFTIGVDRTPTISVKAGKARLHAFTLSLGGAKISRAGLGTNVSGVAVKLSAKGAAALNGAFGVKAFKRGLRVGTATVKAAPGAGRLHRRSHLARARPRHRSGADLAGRRGRPRRAGDRQPGRQPRLPHHRRQGRRQDAGRQHHPQRRAHADQGLDRGHGDRLHHRDGAGAEADGTAGHDPLRPRDARPRSGQDDDLRPVGDRRSRGREAHQGRRRRAQPGLRDDRVHRRPRHRHRHGGRDRLVDAPHLPPAPHPQGSGASRTATLRASCHHHAHMIRVLVVDDHPVLRAGLEAVLRTEPGFVCVGTAGDGHELLAALRHTRPDVVLLDWRLGDEDGVALCRTLRAETAPPEVVLYTATADSGLEAQASAAGAYAVVEKSADIDQLFDALRLAARGGRQAA